MWVGRSVATIWPPSGHTTGAARVELHLELHDHSFLHALAADVAFMPSNLGCSGWKPAFIWVAHKHRKTHCLGGPTPGGDETWEALQLLLLVAHNTLSSRHGGGAVPLARFGTSKLGELNPLHTGLLAKSRPAKE